MHILCGQIAISSEFDSIPKPSESHSEPKVAQSTSVFVVYQLNARSVYPKDFSNHGVYHTSKRYVPIFNARRVTLLLCLALGTRWVISSAATFFFFHEPSFAPFPVYCVFAFSCTFSVCEFCVFSSNVNDLPPDFPGKPTLASQRFGNALFCYFGVYWDDIV